jgi:hypothetical protein
VRSAKAEEPPRCRVAGTYVPVCFLTQAKNAQPSETDTLGRCPDTGPDTDTSRALLLRTTFLEKSQLIALMQALASKSKNPCSWQIKCTRIDRQGETMALRIVWRNPIPSNSGDAVERVADDEFGTVYEVRRPGRTLVFEVTYGCRFSRKRRTEVHPVGESA